MAQCTGNTVKRSSEIIAHLHYQVCIDMENVSTEPHFSHSVEKEARPYLLWRLFWRLAR